MTPEYGSADTAWGGMGSGAGAGIEVPPLTDQEARSVDESQGEARLPGPGRGAATKGAQRALAWLVALVVAGMAVGSLQAQSQTQPELPPTGVDLVFDGCAGWGLCTFHVAGRVPLTGGFRIRLRGVGHPDRSGTCTFETENTRTLREYLEGILRRARHIRLADPAPRTDGAVLATAYVDGAKLTDILVHAGIGRTQVLSPTADWCD
jgi:hypothetical protein